MDPSFPETLPPTELCGLGKALPVSELNILHHNMGELQQQLNATCTKTSLPCQACDR